MIRTYASAEILFKEAQEMGLDPQWETPHGLFSIQNNSKSIYVFYTKLHINSQLGAWMSQDKYLTHIMMQKHDLPDIPFCYTTQLKEVNQFLDTHRTIIQKPVLGQKAENTLLIEKHDEIQKGNLDEWIFEKYIPGTEHRYLVLQGKVIAVQEKTLTPTQDHPWKKTYRTLDEVDWNGQMIKMSTDIANLFHMGLLAVDFILNENNKIWILETNSMPSLHSFYHPDEGRVVEVARKILSSIIASYTS